MTGTCRVWGLRLAIVQDKDFAEHSKQNASAYRLDVKFLKVIAPDIGPLVFPS